MKKSTFSEQQNAYASRQAEGGTPVGDVCRQLGVSEATFSGGALPGAVVHRLMGGYGIRGKGDPT
jgi:hypothetical protein